MIAFTVFGEPVAQGRPRFARMGAGVRAYDPEKSHTYKDYVRTAALEVKPDKPLDGPLLLVVEAYRSIPKSMSKKKRVEALAGSLQPTTKPDLDNIIKGLKDALKGIIWCDDSQVVNIVAGKWYSDRPRVEITVKEATP